MADVIYSYIGVFKHFRWRKVVMIVQEENLFTEVHCMHGSWHHSVDLGIYCCND